MEKNKYNYLVGKCQYCGEDVWSNQLADIPGKCVHRKCLDNYNELKVKP